VAPDPTDTLDPEIAEVLAGLPETPLDLDAARRLHLEGARAVSGPGEPMARVEDVQIPGHGGYVPARLYVPDAGASHGPLIVHLHGGGWVVGSIESYDPVCRALANAAGAAVLGVEYRLAPEDPFPAALDDAWAALRWTAEHAEEHGCDPRRLAVAGDSAGGNLAAAVARRARDHGGPPLRFQLLVYPVTDPARASASYATYGEGFGLTGEAMAWYWESYLGGSDPTNPDAAPAGADLAGLPPALVVLASHDPLHDEGAAYAERLREAGDAVRTLDVPGTVHGFWRMLAVSRVARETMGEVGRELRRALRP
jgi:acetyl esterase